MPGVYFSVQSAVWFDTESPWSCQQAHMLYTASHTRAHSLTHTRHTEPEPTWVVKLAACISGIDLLAIKPCHCCHLNFGLGASSNPQPHPIHHPPPPLTPHTITTNSFLCTIFIRVENGWDTNRAFHDNVAVPPSCNWQTSYDSLDFKKNSFISLLQKLTSSSSPLWNISLLLKPKPTGAKSQRSLLLKLPSYHTKYRQDIASQIEW